MRVCSIPMAFSRLVRPSASGTVFAHLFAVSRPFGAVRFGRRWLGKRKMGERTDTRKRTCRSYAVSSFALGSGSPICRPPLQPLPSDLRSIRPASHRSPSLPAGTGLFHCGLHPWARKEAEALRRLGGYFLLSSPAEPSLRPMLRCRRSPHRSLVRNNQVAPPFRQISAALSTRANSPVPRARV